MHIRALPLAWLFVVAVTLVACGGENGRGAAEGLEVGSAAPPFSLPTSEGGRVSLDDLLDRRPVLLYFSMGPG